MVGFRLGGINKALQVLSSIYFFCMSSVVIVVSSQPTTNVLYFEKNDFFSFGLGNFCLKDGIIVRC